jgi:lipoteichoic acid synthase
LHIYFDRYTRPSAYATLGIFIGLLLGSLFARLFVLQELALVYLNCRWCIVASVINADIPLLGVLAWLFIIGLMTAHRIFSITLRSLVMMGVLFYVADVVVMSQFVVRLSISDFVTYLAQPFVIWRHLSTFSTLQIFIASMILLASVALTIHKPNGLISRRTLGGWTVSLVGLALINPLVFPAPTLVHDWAIRNVFMANQPTGVSRDYGASTRERIMKDHLADTENTKCRTGHNRKGNIVVLVIESWSAYHSAYWSGLNDWTPRLDEIARKSLSFRNFHSGGPNTMEGLMALFTGRDFALPIAKPIPAAPFETAWGLSISLPRLLKSEGYHTAFLTSGNLAFTRTGEWLKNIGFDYVEGHEYIGYKGIERHQFESVADDVLYNRVIKYIGEVGIESPLFLVVETVSSHHPFVHPYTKERSEEAVFRYVDGAAVDFIEELESHHFFQEGILVVLSDHRAMTILPQVESRLFGRGAASHIPAFIVSGEVGGQQVDRIFHQADLMPTLIAHVSDKYCFTGPVRDMLAVEDTEPRCVFHARGDRRDHINVLCADGSGTVKVDGDDSRFVNSENLSLEAQRLMLNKIAWQRINAQETAGSP